MYCVDVPIHLRRLPHYPWPVTLGVPVGKGQLPSDARLNGRLLTSDAPCQVRPLARWTDGSPKWLLVTFIAHRDQPSEDILRITTAEGRPNGQTLTWPKWTSLDTKVHLYRDKTVQFVKTDEQLVDNGEIFCQRIDSWQARGIPYLRCWHEWTYFAPLKSVRLRVTVRNSRRARHRGGLWDLGDPGSVFINSLSVRSALSITDAHLVLEDAKPQHVDGTWRLVQASSGGQSWNSPVHVAYDGKVHLPYRGYRVYQPDAAGKSKETYRGTRALPAVIASTPNGLLQIVPEAFWQQFPQAVEWNGRHLVWQPWADLAGEYDDRSERGDRSRCTELQGGEQKTWTIWFVSGDDPVRSVIDRPPLAVASAEYLVTTGTLWPFSSKPRLRPEAEQLLDELRHGPRCIEEKRERIDEYGWRHYGEWYADHEQRYYKGSEPLVSHYNNQYDLVYGLILHWLRTADPFFWDEAARLARHVIDIDIYHTTEDRPVYNGGLFWHTDHYVSAHTATHRTFSCKNAGNLGSRYGGGPGNEHNYTSGLLHYYFLTGDWTAREAVLGLADWVLAREDPNSTVLGLVAPRPTGRASSTTHGNYHGPGRGAGNSINALFDAWWLSQDSQYLTAAQELIRRTIHPQDDFAQLALEHIEHRWSYTVHLAILMRYAYLLANDKLDTTVGYVFRCLKHYGQWMTRHEKPYFDREAELEYPTETWGAHDIRKGNVLRLIGGWVGTGDEAEGMVKRGRELADRGWYDLMRFDTRAATRPVAIVLQECLRQVSPVPNYRPTGLASVTKWDEALRWAGPFVGQRDWIKMQLRSPLGWARLLVNLCQITRWSKVRWGI